MGVLNNILVVCLLVGSTFAKTPPVKGSIGFPEIEEDVNSVNKDNRQPVYIPAMCPENELFYPGDQTDDWICDCRPAYLYYPKSDKCWPAYRKGPCQDGYYLLLLPNSAIPVCEKNPCPMENYVMYNGRCEGLETVTPCRHLWPIPAALAVNATTLSITCEKISLENRFAESPPAPLTVASCPPGCRRSINGKCSAATP